MSGGEGGKTTGSGVLLGGLVPAQLFNMETQERMLLTEQNLA